MDYFENIESAAEAEASLAPGVYQIRFYLDEPASLEDVAEIRESLEIKGVEVSEVARGIEEGIPYLAVTYNRQIPTGTGVALLPMTVIPLIGLVIIAGLIGIGIFKWEEVTTGLMKVLLVGGGICIVLFALARKPAMQYLEKR